jgi:hypothetical protein
MIAERWGDKYIDRRNWPCYNRLLVERGSLLVNNSILDLWQSDVDGLNQGKYGHPYEFPEVLFLWGALLHVVFHMPYRQIEGYMKMAFPSIKVPCYATLYNRINSIDFESLFNELDPKKKKGL